MAGRTRTGPETGRRAGDWAPLEPCRAISCLTDNVLLAGKPRLIAKLRGLHSCVTLLVRSAFRPTGCPGAPAKARRCANRGRHVGNFHLVEKEGGRVFTDAGEETLVPFAAQAAAAIANARACRAERRARADLEALVETSPVGVAVFDAATGRAVSSNREAPRIVETLRAPDGPPDELLSILTFRRADGPEIALDRLPLAEALGSGETLRAKEIELTIPDGASVAKLVNATPIQGSDGAPVSVVVTMQDLAPLEELDRMRAEFLGMRSPEPASRRRRHLPPRVPLRRGRPHDRRLTCRPPPTDRAGQRGERAGERAAKLAGGRGRLPVAGRRPVSPTQGSIPPGRQPRSSRS